MRALRKRTLRSQVLFAIIPLLVSSPALAQPEPDAPTTAPDATEEASSKGLTPPTLQQFVEAEYPPAAKREGRTATVVLKLEIDAEGKVTEATVHTPAGFGFDEAAKAAAERFVFTPAMRQGQPVNARILYRYEFRQKESSPVGAAKKVSGAETPTRVLRAKIGGTIRLADGDQPMPGAVVTLVSEDGEVKEVPTDAKGTWGSRLAPGRYTVQVRAPGFRPFEARELLVGGESLEVVYRLRPKTGAIEVTIEGERPQREVTRRTLDREEMAMIPGTRGDALKAVQAMPGVARARGMQGFLIVRGSPPDGTHVFIDGIWVPRIYHFGSLSSVMPTEMLDKLDFYPGNFSARYGRGMGGIVDATTRDLGAGDGKYHGLAQVDLIDARLMLRGPVPLLEDWSFSMGGRRSHLDAWLPKVVSDKVTFRAAPVYYDYQAFLGTKPTPTSSFRLGFFGSDDGIALLFPESRTALDPGAGAGVSNNASFWRMSHASDNEKSKDLSVKGSASYGHDNEDFQRGSIHGNTDLAIITTRGELSYRFSPQFTVRGGPDLVFVPYEVDSHVPQPPRPGEPDPGPLSSRPFITVRDSGWISSPAGFLELDWTPNESAQVLLGGRVDSFSFDGNDTIDISPRLNARYDLYHGFPRSTIKGGVGLFYENPQPEELIDAIGTPTLHSNRAVHYSVGYEQQIAKGLDISVEGFYKALDELVVRTPTPDGSFAYDNGGTGEVVGVETLLRYKSRGRFFGWIAYTVSRSSRRDDPEEPARLFEFDQTHNLTVVGSYKLGRGWQAGARFRYVSGNPYTPCLGGVLNAASGSYACRSGLPYSERIPAFHQLDLRVDKTWDFEVWRLTAYLDVQNVYNRKNPEAISYNYNYTESDFQTGIPILPNLGLRGEF